MARKAAQRSASPGRVTSVGVALQRFELLKEWLEKEAPEAVSKSAFKAIMRLAEESACLHRAYHCYTSFDAVKGIFGGINGAMWRSTNLVSSKLNDWNESGKYGKKTEALKTCIVCFNHDTAEDANLWWLYAKGNPKSLRVTLPQPAFKKWCDYLKKDKVVAADVVYAAVRNDGDRYPQARQNVLRWEDATIVVQNLEKLIRDRNYTGRLKDYEWRSERETRLIAKIDAKSDDRFVKFDIPDDVIRELRFTTSPWATDADYIEMRDEVAALLERYGWKKTRENFRSSVLEGKMNVVLR